MPAPRTLVVCLDGTGKKFGDYNSNTVLLHSMLEKDNDQQPVYYQSGVGTLSGPDNDPVQRLPLMERLNPSRLRPVELAFATCLRAHVTGAYWFLVNEYKAGDKICMLGYSRGAYAARVLAGMIAKVGLAVSCNRELVDEAYEIYLKDDAKGWIESENFKNTYSMEVMIKFVGVWDTVSSVGYTALRLPLTCDNPCIEIFRHALSLDERRIHFQPLLYHSGKENGRKWLRSVREQQYQDQTRPPRDVSEVWFAGSHADVGGGAVQNGELHSLAYITLRWMIRQCFLADTGIKFKYEKLEAIGFELDLLEPHVLQRPQQETLTLETLSAAQSGRKLGNSNMMVTENHRDLMDVLSPTHDSLDSPNLWWLLEFTGGWHHEHGRLAPHNGHGRVVEQRRGGIQVHRSVKLRMDAGKLLNNSRRTNDGSLGFEGYNPAAKFSGDLVWVD